MLNPPVPPRGPTIKPGRNALAEAEGTAQPPSQLATEAPVPQKALYAALGVGLTANSVAMMTKVVFALWAVHLQLSPTAIGMAVAANALMPFLLSIHGGVLMDRLGTRRVTLVYVVTTALLMPLYPVLPFYWAIIILQLITGLTANMGWVGAQALICNLSSGKTTLIARFSVAGKLGTLFAPVAVGLAWDIGGPWGAFVFVTLAAWLVVLALWIAPTDADSTPRPTAQDVICELQPKLSDYVRAFSLIAIPTVAFVVVMSALRISSSAVQTSFYVVYLGEIGMLGTIIGLLVGISEGAGLIGALMAGFWERYIKPHWVFILFVVISLICVSITPLLGGAFAFLAIATFGRGYAQGLSQPVMFGILSRAVSRSEQGTSIGLRTTSNRFASLIVPAVMGIVAEAVGIGASFFWVGGTLVVLCCAVALFVNRLPNFKS
jgi:MFS family permease